MLKDKLDSLVGKKLNFRVKCICCDEIEVEDVSILEKDIHGIYFYKKDKLEVLDKDKNPVIIHNVEMMIHDRDIININNVSIVLDPVQQWRKQEKCKYVAPSFQLWKD